VVDVVIRPARTDETGLLAAVERDGDRRYAGYDGVPEGFDDVVAPLILTAACKEGRLWVAASTLGGALDREPDEGGIIGFVMAEIVDGLAHVAQVSVKRDFQGDGLGRRLIEKVVRWARDGSMAAVTLCTFADVDWNRPLYAHLGFSVVPEEEWTPDLRALFEADGELGLDLERRVVMRRETAD
jgi:GNAT superfamily N-acetyltransferase